MYNLQLLMASSKFFFHFGIATIPAAIALAGLSFNITKSLPGSLPALSNHGTPANGGCAHGGSGMPS
jgi:hypothetical protein